MANDLLWLIARINVALTAGVILVLMMRAPARRLFGAQVAYALWAMPLLAAAACLLPARVETIIAPALPIDLSAPAPGAYTALDPRMVLALWIGGVATSLIVLILRQTRFARGLGRLQRREDLGERVLVAESSEHGPAVFGVLRPVIVAPADFDARFTDEERRIVLAHERAHMAQGDPLINAVAAALQCLNWFNPFVHLGVRALRVDQELACDAVVLASSARRSYAEAILKTQIAAGAPLGCAWPSHSLAALKERIAMLKHNLPTRTQRILGVSAVGLASFAACAVAWAAQPARVVVADAPATSIKPLPAEVFTIGDPSPQAVTVQASLTDGERAQIRAAIADAHLTPAQRARIEGALNRVPSADSDDSEQAQDDAENLAGDDSSADDDADGDDVDADIDAQLDGQGVVIDQGGNITSTRHLTPEQRARIRTAVQQAMRAQRAAMAQARVAMRDARREIDRAQIAETATPEMRAEIAAITAEATRMSAAAAQMNQREREAMRADMHARAEHLREMARQMADEARAEAQAEVDRQRADHDADQGNDN